jgi:hypothetical protein
MLTNISHIGLPGAAHLRQIFCAPIYTPNVIGADHHWLQWVWLSLVQDLQRVPYKIQNDKYHIE